MYYNVKESGARIRSLREMAGISRTGLAEAVGVTADALRKIERGTNGSRIDTLVLLAEYFHVSLDYLVCGYRDRAVEKGIFEGLDENEICFLKRVAESIKENMVYLKNGMF